MLDNPLQTRGGKIYTKIKGEINDHILDEIESKHGISFAEVDEVCVSERGHAKIAFQPDNGRALYLIVLANLGRGCRRIVAARDMSNRI